VEFGLFMNGYLPGPAAHDSECEHEMLMRELNYAIHADKYNWKYLWFGEHHALTEYSHMSAPEVAMGYVAARTEQIHVGSAIMNLSPRVNHPVRNAERAAMLDHVSNNRYEWGTGRGAGSHEIASFNILDKDSTKVEWEEVIVEIPRMWEQIDYTFEGDHFTVGTPHNILPKPYGKGHPPIWVACGNPGTFSRAGELGIGAIAFNFEPIFNLRGRLEAYKEGIANCTEPLGQFMNDNVMMTNAVICLEDRARARQIALEQGRGYLNTMVNMYHDTMPKKEGARIWPAAPRSHPQRRGARSGHRRWPHALRHPRRGSGATVPLPGGGLRSGRVRHSAGMCPQRRGHRDDRVVRQQGDPPVRHGSRSLDHPVPRDRPAQVPTVRPSGSRCAPFGAADLGAHPRIGVTRPGVSAAQRAATPAVDIAGRMGR
jgi:alkanesulfonate monooxygenase SsuD/methylene tetrahydromethanopterin reductase-like flavin-dependent oxidoreductase (luciferase family)